MAKLAKFLQGVAGAAGGGGLNVEDVFSTYMYDGNSSTQTITNGLDLSTEGGLVILRARDAAANTFFWDSERGTSKYIMSATSQVETTQSGVTAFNTDGFTLGSYGGTNSSSFDYVSWSFRKAPKFFDVVTYTGNGVSGREIAHNLGSSPGCIMIKRRDAATDWFVWHRSGTPQNYQYFFNLNATAAWQTYGVDAFGSSTSYTFNDSVFTVGDYSPVNQSGNSYVAYIFAHNNSDGDFGPTGDQDIIKCGSYTGTGSAGNLVNLGFEAQWVLIKREDSNSDWRCVDVWRGMAGHTGTIANSQISAKFNNTEQESAENVLVAKPNGFEINNTTGIYNGSGGTYIYIAIRRPTGIPENATDVFGVETGSNNGSSTTIGGRYRPGFSVDMALEKVAGSIDNWELSTRLISGTSLRPNGTNVEDTGVGGSQFDFQDGWNSGTPYSASYSWMWKRAPKFFDVVTYTGNSTAGRTVSHNLGVAPEMMWVKSRETAAGWMIYHKDVGATKYLQFTTSTPTTGSSTWDDTSPTSLDFTLGSFSFVNQASYNYVAYLFASLAGISKVGSYTGDGTTGRVIDCGFSNGARFVLIKPTSQTGGWTVYDTARGIVAGNDPILYLNSSGAQVTNQSDDIDANSSGFIVNHDALGAFLNGSGVDYIFYAIA